MNKKWIEVKLWEPIPDKPGLIRVCGCKTIKQVEAELEEYLTELGLLDELDYFLVDMAYKSAMRKKEDIAFPEFDVIACYPTTGGNEGHYIHVVALRSDGTFSEVFLGKTFRGYDHACKVASELAKVLA